MSELDELLRGSLGRLAEPGDPTGVLDAIRSRVEAAGPNGDGGSGPGGAGASPWAGPAALGVIALAAAAGGVGLAWAAPGPSAPVVASPEPVVVAAGIDGAACPGGPAVATLDPGARVLAIARSEDGGYLQVRNPAALGTTVWVRAAEAVVDPGQDVDALPVASCSEGGEITVQVTEAPAPEPVVTEAPEPQPGPAPKPTPPADSSPPVIDAGAWSTSVLYGAGWGGGCVPTAATITITATDDIGVTSVAATSTFAGLTPTLQSQSGSTWTYGIATPTWGQPSLGSDVPITFIFTAYDATGKSASDQASLTYYYCLN